MKLTRMTELQLAARHAARAPLRAGAIVAVNAALKRLRFRAYYDIVQAVYLTLGAALAAASDWCFVKGKRFSQWPD